MPFTREQKEEFRLVIKDVMRQIFEDEEYLATLVSRVCEHAGIQKQLGTLEEKVTELQKENLSLKTQLDAVEQYSRKPNIKISGIAEEKNENLNKVVISLIKDRMQIDIEDRDISICHRIGKQKNKEQRRPVIVRFANLSLKQKIMAKRSSLKNTSIFINDDLTQLRYDLFLKCRDKLDRGNVWIYNGKVHIKTMVGGNERRFVVEKLEDLIVIKGPAGSTRNAAV